MTLFFLLLAGLVGGRSLERVFGPVGRQSEVLDAGGTQEYLSARSGSCSYPFELVLLQESSARFEDDFVEMKERQLPAILNGLSKSHPNSTVAAAFFSDKPIAPFGDPLVDYCQHLYPLDVESSRVIEEYASTKAQGGGDAAQNNLGALLAVAESKVIGWDTNKLATKLIVHVTDSAPHFYSGNFDAGLDKPSGHFRDEVADWQCVTEFYPSPAQTKEALERLNNLYVVHLVYDPSYLQGEVAKSWIWFNRYLNRTDDFVNLRESDSSDLWHKLESIIRKIDELECAPNRPLLWPSTRPTCRPGEVVCQDGVSVVLGFKPDLLTVQVAV